MDKEHFLRKGVVTQDLNLTISFSQKKIKNLGVQIELICLPSSLAKNMCLMTVQYLS